MIIGVFGDTHTTPTEITKLATADMVKRGAEMFVCTGDIESRDCVTDLCFDRPVVCALIDRQQFDPAFTFPPSNWAFTRPSNYNLFTTATTEDRHNSRLRENIATRLGIANRIRNAFGTAMYVGHTRSIDVMMDSERFSEFTGLINSVYDGVHYVFTGHTHHQFLIQRNGFSWVNPGSIDIGVSKDYEYALIDTESGEVIFTRLPYAVTNFHPISVGIISDVGNASDRDQYFWERLRLEFKRRDVSVVIIDGALMSRDIGRFEFNDFQVYYSPSSDQEVGRCYNWHPISLDNPVIEICGNNFLVKHSMGVDLDGKTESAIIGLVRAESQKYHHIDIVVCGGIHNALFEEHEEVMVINPGDVRNHQKFVVVCIRPHLEVTFSQLSTS